MVWLTWRKKKETLEHCSCSVKTWNSFLHWLFGFFVLLRNVIYHIKQYIGFFRTASLGVRPKGTHLLKKILTPSNLNLWLVSPTFGPVIMTLWCFWVWLLWNFNESSSLSISEWSWPCGCFYFHLVRFGQH